MKTLKDIIEEMPKYRNGSKAIPKDDVVVQYSTIKSLSNSILSWVIGEIENRINILKDNKNKDFVNKEKLENKITELKTLISHFNNLKEK